jgi:hypothetical protein
MPEHTTCTRCNRIVEAGHVNRAGRCVFCAEPPADKPADDKKDDDA